MLSTLDDHGKCNITAKSTGKYKTKQDFDPKARWFLRRENVKCGDQLMTKVRIK